MDIDAVSLKVEGAFHEKRTFSLHPFFKYIESIKCKTYVCDDLCLTSSFGQKSDYYD